MLTPLARIDGAVSDGALAVAYLDGDADAFAVLYDRYYDRLVRTVARMLPDRALAEDVAQEALICALLGLHGYDPHRPFWPWVKRIARNVAAQTLQRRAYEVAVDDLPAVAVRADDTDAVALRSMLASCLARIPVRQRQALLMRFGEDRDPAELAESFGIDTGAVAVLLWRARKSFLREYAAFQARCGAVAAAFTPARVRRWIASLPARLSPASRDALPRAGEVATGWLAVAACAVASVLAAAPHAPRTGGAAAGDAAVAHAHVVHTVTPLVVTGAATGAVRALVRDVPRHVRPGNVIHRPTPILPDPLPPPDTVSAVVNALENALPAPPCDFPCHVAIPVRPPIH